MTSNSDKAVQSLYKDCKNKTLATEEQLRRPYRVLQCREEGGGHCHGTVLAFTAIHSISVYGGCNMPARTGAKLDVDGQQRPVCAM